MRIFIASGIFHPESGGPATYLYRFLPELQVRGHMVTALTFGDALTEGYPYPLTRIPRRGFPRRYWAYYRAARRWWPGHDLAYVHSLELPLPSTIRPRVGKIVGDLAWERAMRKGWIPPSANVDHFQATRYSPRVEIDKFLRAREARRLDHLIVPSEYLRRMVLGWGVDPARVSVVYNALETQREPSENQAQARAHLGLPDVPLLFTPARLTPWKGIDHTLHALTRIGNMHLLVAGEGPSRPAFEKLAQDLGLAERVRFVGHVPHEGLPLYFRAADYTLLYSGYEGLPHVLLESLSVGTPLIASDKGGNPEVVQHGVNGLLVPYMDVEALASTIEAAFAPGKQGELSAGTSVGLERFEWPRLAEQTMVILERYGE